MRTRRPETDGLCVLWEQGDTLDEPERAGRRTSREQRRHREEQLVDEARLDE